MGLLVTGHDWERLSELQDIFVKTSKTEKQRKKKKDQQNVLRTWDSYEKGNIEFTEVSEGEEK